MNHVDQAIEAPNEHENRQRDVSSMSGNSLNPENIKIRMRTMTVAQVVSRIDRESINMDSELQRRSGIWNAKIKSRLIESLLLNIPISPFYVAEDYLVNWAVVDGIHRMTAIYEFIKNRFELYELEYLTSCEKKSYRNLSRAYQRRIEETELVIYVVDASTPEGVMFNVFKRFNTGDPNLSGQEIRHAMNPGRVPELLARLAECPEFIESTDGDISPDRMEDRECVLRVLAFIVNSWEQYKGNGLDAYLGSAMKELRLKTDGELESIEKTFRAALKTAYQIFGETAFRKLNRQGKDRKIERGSINKELFEIWGVELARRTPRERGILISKKDLIVQRFIDKLEFDQEFNRSISASYAGPDQVRIRFETVHRIVEELI